MCTNHYMRISRWENVIDKWISYNLPHIAWKSRIALDKDGVTHFLLHKVKICTDVYLRVSAVSDKHLQVAKSCRHWQGTVSWFVCINYLRQIQRMMWKSVGRQCAIHHVAHNSPNFTLYLMHQFSIHWDSKSYVQIYAAENYE